MGNPLAFCTLGMFIIDPDEIEYINGKAAEQTIIGGAGTYAAVGARLATGNRNAQRVGWIIDEGSDFPTDFKDILQSWHTSCLFRSDQTRLTTRAWNGYGANEYRAFKYTTPKLRLDEKDLTDDQILSDSFHMVCSAQRCISLVTGIEARRQELRSDALKPIFVWEPVPDLCSPEEFQALCDAVSYVDIVSPNAEELESFFGTESTKLGRTEMVSRILQSVPGTWSKAALVVREGAGGSIAYTERSKLHIPAYHQNNHHVRDVTGGGNTFLGALAVAMTKAVEPSLESFEKVIYGKEQNSRCYEQEQKQRELLFAIVHASVAASYAIEQTGPPTLVDPAEDCWNEERYRDRYLSFVDREKIHILNELSSNKSLEK